MFCHCRRLLGHNLECNAQYFTLKKNGAKEVCQYGDWLKSSGGGLDLHLGKFRPIPSNLMAKHLKMSRLELTIDMGQRWRMVGTMLKTLQREKVMQKRIM